MSVETDPIPPVPQHTPPIDKKTGALERFENNWMQWFLAVRNKINVINSLIFEFSQLLGTGFPSIDTSGSTPVWTVRTIDQGDGIDIVDGDGVAGNPTISHADTSSIANYAVDNSDGTVLQDVSFTFDTFGHVQTISFNSVDLDLRYQSLDATLSALAGQNWASNAFPIGTGADTVAQVSFAANTFPARASTGNLVAKSITDFALTLLDDDTDTAARATLNIPTLAYGTYTPVATSITNMAVGITPLDAQYLRIGNVVTVSGRINGVGTTLAAPTLSQFRLSLPIATNFGTTGECCGAGGRLNTSSVDSILITSQTANDEAQFSFLSTATAAGVVSFTLTYQIL